LELKHLPPRNEVVHAYADHSKVKSIFNVSEYTLLQEGINKMASWAKEVGSRESSRFENIEIMENLPPAWRTDN